MTRIIVIGGANADIKGRAGGALIAGSSNPGDVVMSAGGVGRNIAENLARLGEHVSLLAMVGDDANGALVRGACASAGVDTSLLKTSGQPTGVYLAVLDAAGEMVTAVNDMRAADTMTAAHLTPHEDEFSAADLLVADCNMPVECLAWLCDFAGRQRKRLVIEPVSVAKAKKLLMFDRRFPVYAVTPNRQQLEALTGEQDVSVGLRVLHGLGFSNIAMHAGKDGVMVSDGPSVSRVAAFPADDIADVTGAGDAAVAGLLCGLAAGFGFPQAARVGQAAASVKLRSKSSVAREITRDRVFQLAGILS